MTDAERRILQNQTEILWVLNYALEKLSPDLVGRGGQLDRMRDDLAAAAKDTVSLLEQGDGDPRTPEYGVGTR